MRVRAARRRAIDKRDLLEVEQNVRAVSLFHFFERGCELLTCAEIELADEIQDIGGTVGAVNDLHTTSKIMNDGIHA